MKKILILIVLITSLISCSGDDASEYNVQIRLSNVSAYDFEEILVNTASVEVNFDNLKAGDKTVYRTFERAYRYGFIELLIDGETYTIQPIDYVGEKLLKEGNYTYQIDANESNKQYGKLILTLVED